MKHFILTITFLFIGIPIVLMGQIKGSYWLTMHSEFREIVSTNPGSFSPSRRLKNVNYQKTILKGGYFVNNRTAFGGRFERHQGVDFIERTSTLYALGGEIYNGEVYWRNYLVNGRRFLWTSELGFGATWNKLDWNEEASPVFTGTIGNPYYYGPESFHLDALINMGFGIRLNANAAFLLNIDSGWSLYSQYPEENARRNHFFELEKIRTYARIEYYFNRPKRVLYQRFQRPFEQRRSYWESNGTVFGTNWSDGASLNAAYGRYYPNGVSYRFWLALTDEYRLVPRITESSLGAAIYKHQQLKKLENTYWVWGGQLGLQDIDNRGFYVKAVGKTMLEYWQANRLRLGIGTMAGVTFYEARYEWNVLGEIEYFLTPNFSWQMAVELPIMQTALKKADRSDNTVQQRWEGNTTQIAVRIWF